MVSVILITAIIVRSYGPKNEHYVIKWPRMSGTYFRVFAVIVSQSAEITSRESVLSEREMTRTEIIVCTSSSGAAK